MAVVVQVVVVVVVVLVVVGSSSSSSRGKRFRLGGADGGALGLEITVCYWREKKKCDRLTRWEGKALHYCWWRTSWAARGGWRLIKAE